MPSQFTALINTSHIVDRNKRPHNPNIVRDSLVQIRVVERSPEAPSAAHALPGAARQQLCCAVATALSLPAFCLGMEIRLSVARTGFR